MRILVTGAAGMLGQDAVTRLREAGHDVIAADRAELDITDPAQVAGAVRGLDAVVNAAAHTAVDDAEAQEAAAFAINAAGPALLARAASATGARLVQVSTDYVFAGDATTPYPEDAPLAPVSAYGRTKAAGEWAVQAAGPQHLVLRTAWLYGAGGASFPATMARLAATRDELQVVSDQVGQPTWTRDVADLIAALLAADAPGGIYHATSSGQTSWFDFARAVVAATGRDPEMVRPTTAAAYARPAPRPAYSVLGHDRLIAAGISPIGEWSARWASAAPGVLAGPHAQL